MFASKASASWLRLRLRLSSLIFLPTISEIYSLDMLFLRLPCAPLTAFSISLLPLFSR